MTHKMVQAAGVYVFRKWRNALGQEEGSSDTGPDVLRWLHYVVKDSGEVAVGMEWPLQISGYQNTGINISHIQSNLAITL